MGFWTEDVVNPGDDGGSFKYHLCVDAHAGLHLFVCSDGYPFDFELPRHRCPGLSREMSYISLSRVIQRRDLPRKHKMACRVSDEFLRELLDYIPKAKSLPAQDKLAVTIGIAAHLNMAS
ncbi:MAG: hypothetical protein WDM86_22750 [Rhizomicrobium sp.]